MDKTRLIALAAPLIETLKKECSSPFVLDLENVLGEFSNLCAETLDSRDDIFFKASELLDSIEKDCSKNIETILKLRDLLNQGSSLKCGGP